jgi:hypothetical protein
LQSKIPRTGIATIGQIIDGCQVVFDMGADSGNLHAVGGNVILQKEALVVPTPESVDHLDAALKSISGRSSGIFGHGKFNADEAFATHLELFLETTTSPSSPTHSSKYTKSSAERLRHIQHRHIKEYLVNRFVASKAAKYQFYFKFPSTAVVMGYTTSFPASPATAPLAMGALRTKPPQERIPEQGWYRRKTPMTIAEAVGTILCAQPRFGSAVVDDSFFAGSFSVLTDPHGFGCLVYNTLYANFPAELFNTEYLAEQTSDFFCSIVIAPGYKAQGCEIDWSDASG